MVFKQAPNLSKSCERLQQDLCECVSLRCCRIVYCAVARLCIALLLERESLRCCKIMYVWRCCWSVNHCAVARLYIALLQECESLRCCETVYFAVARLYIALLQECESLRCCETAYFTFAIFVYLRCCRSVNHYAVANLKYCAVAGV